MWNKSIRKRVVLCHFFLLLCTFSAVSLAQDFVVLVNTENTISGSDDELKLEVKRLFLRQKKRWSSGIDATPLAPLEDSEAYDAFLNQVLKMKKSQLEQFWRKARQKSGTTPTRPVRSDRLAIRLVEKREGGFAVISTDSALDLPENTRILFSF